MTSCPPQTRSAEQSDSKRKQLARIMTLMTSMKRCQISGRFVWNCLGCNSFPVRNQCCHTRSMKKSSSQILKMSGLEASSTSSQKQANQFLVEQKGQHRSILRQNLEEAATATRIEKEIRSHLDISTRD